MGQGGRETETKVWVSSRWGTSQDTFPQSGLHLGLNPFSSQHAHTPQGSQEKLLRLLARQGGKKKKERKPHILGHGPQNGFVT